ncbi:hypothetical protein J4471_04025 [Candidatus Woesearchaeota archaeon]|nr:hypothetical protein [Candidatus Woesearchaeota archaeon]
MEIGKIFNKSWDELIKNKVFILPVIIMIIIPFLLFLIFLGFTDLGGIYKDLVDKPEILENSEDSTEKFAEIFTVKNIVLGIIFISIGIILNLYFSCCMFALISMNIKKIELNYHHMISFANKFFIRFIGLNLLVLIIIALPLIVLWILAAITYINYDNLAIILILLSLIISFIYFIYIALKLFFINPIIFLDNKSASASIKESFKLTKGKMKDIIVLTLVILGITLISNFFINTPMQASIFWVIKTDTLMKIMVGIILALIFLILSAIVYMFIQLFIFYAYINFRKKL